MFVFMTKKKYHDNLTAALQSGFELGHEAGFALATRVGVILPGVVFKKQSKVESEVDNILKEEGL